MDEAEFVMTTEYESVKSPFSKIRPEDRFNLERNDENAVNAVQQPVAVNVQAAFSKSVAVSKPVTAARRVSLAANFQSQMDDDEHEPAVVSAPRRHSTLGMNNLMVMTQSSKTKMEATKASLEEIKPEKDPWWNERNKERDMRRAHNPVSENIRQHAKSKLLQPTRASMAGARKKKAEQDKEETKQRRARDMIPVESRIKGVESNAQFLRPTIGYKQHKAAGEEPAAPSDETIVRSLNQFGNIGSFNHNRHGGTYGFGLATSRDALAEPTPAPRELTQPVVSDNSRLLMLTKASKDKQRIQEEQAPVKKAPFRVADLNSQVYSQTRRTVNIRKEFKQHSQPFVNVRRSSVTNGSNNVAKKWSSNTSNAKSLDAGRRTSMAANDYEAVTYAPQEGGFGGHAAYQVGPAVNTVSAPFRVAERSTASSQRRASMAQAMIDAANEVPLPPAPRHVNPVTTTSSSLLRPTLASRSLQGTLPKQADAVSVYSAPVRTKIAHVAPIYRPAVSAMPPVPPATTANTGFEICVVQRQKDNEDTEDEEEAEAEFVQVDEEVSFRSTPNRIRSAKKATPDASNRINVKTPKTKTPQPKGKSSLKKVISSGSGKRSTGKKSLRLLMSGGKASRVRNTPKSTPAAAESDASRDSYVSPLLSFTPVSVGATTSSSTTGAVAVMDLGQELAQQDNDMEIIENENENEAVYETVEAVSYVVKARDEVFEGATEEEAEEEEVEEVGGMSLAGLLAGSPKNQTQKKALTPKVKTPKARTPKEKTSKAQTPKSASAKSVNSIIENSAGMSMSTASASMLSPESVSPESVSSEDPTHNRQIRISPRKNESNSAKKENTNKVNTPLANKVKVATPVSVSTNNGIFEDKVTPKSKVNNSVKKAKTPKSSTKKSERSASKNKTPSSSYAPTDEDKSLIMSTNRAARSAKKEKVDFALDAISASVAELLVDSPMPADKKSPFCSPRARTPTTGSKNKGNRAIAVLSAEKTPGSGGKRTPSRATPPGMSMMEKSQFGDSPATPSIGGTKTTRAMRSHKTQIETANGTVELSPQGEGAKKIRARRQSMSTSAIMSLKDM